MKMFSEFILRSFADYLASDPSTACDVLDISSETLEQTLVKYLSSSNSLQLTSF